MDEKGFATSPMSPPPPSPCQRRPSCTDCNRPQRVCLCHVIPKQPIETQTEILVLHHPHEAQHKLNTTPFLAKSLRNVTRILGRRLLHQHLAQCTLPAIYLFPSSPSSQAIKLSELKSQTIGNAPRTLIVIDATWKHAKEMVTASEEALRHIGAMRVSLDEGIDESMTGGSIYDSELLLRKEPFGGCVSTMEAVARCLRTIEPEGLAIERRLIEVLRETVKLQAGFLKPMKPRTKLVKKNKQSAECSAAQSK